jgi:MoxR-like ATPase
MNDERTPPVISESEAVRFAQSFDGIVTRVGEEVFGKRDRIELAVVCLLAGGHLLIEDNPGVAKTSLARALAEAIGGDFARVQFTADLLPADIIGGLIYRAGKEEMEPRLGPVFTNVLLADEINRAAPRTQAALLEAMAESQVTIDGTAYELPDPFLCIATQNPVEMHGTYQLPEAQLDRFSMRLTLGYPDPATEVRAIGRRLAETGRRRPTKRPPVEPLDRIKAMIKLVGTVFVADTVREYVAAIAAETRGAAGQTHGISLGISPRGSITLARCAAVRAVSQGRTHVYAQDVRDLAVRVLAHRIITVGDDQDERTSAEQAIETVIAAVPMPAREPLRAMTPSV